MPRDLTDKSIIITGASSGIGAATSLECAQAGMHVVLNARRENRLRELQSRIEQLGRRAIVIAGDVTEAGINERMLDAAEHELGGMHAVFANAGYGVNKSVIEKTDDELRHMFDVNFFAGVRLLRDAAKRLLRAERPGHLLMCSSCLSKFALPYHANYSATKAAQNSICAGMRLELEHHGIYVSSVHPITTTTEFFEVSARLSGNASGANIPEHAPSLFVQPPERVARAIVKCLRSPKPEVWTSRIVRTVAGLMTIFPSFYDWSMRRQMKDEMRAGKEPETKTTHPTLESS